MSYSLCSKCGNIKAAGSTDCSFCSSGEAKSVSLQDLKQGIQGKQGEGAPPTPAPASTAAAAADPIDFKFVEPQTSPPQPQAPPPPPQEPVQAKAVIPEAPAAESKRVEAEPTAEKPAASTGGFMGWLRRLFGLK